MVTYKDESHSELRLVYTPARLVGYGVRCIPLHPESIEVEVPKMWSLGAIEDQGVLRSTVENAESYCAPDKKMLSVTAIRRVITK